jgi:hypothetical protein
VVRFTTTLLPAEIGTFVEIPAEVVAALRATGRTSVVGTVDGQPFRNQFMPYRYPDGVVKVMMVVNRAVRSSIGKEAGDELLFDLERDARPRSADLVIPPELEAALAADADLRAAWDRLAPSRKRDDAEAIAMAKRPETRQRRLAATLDRLRR